MHPVRINGRSQHTTISLELESNLLLNIQIFQPIDQQYVYVLNFNLQASGIGKLKPNILLMGFKEDWQTCDKNEIIDYVEVMQ